MLLFAAACSSDGDEGGGDQASASPDQADTSPIVIGYAASVTGPLAPYDSVPGVECAIANINEAGGVMGHQLELIVGDIKSDAVEAATVAKNLLDQGAQIMFSSPTDDTSIPVATAALPDMIPTLSVIATQPAFVQAMPDNGFLVLYGDNESAAAIAQYAVENDGIKTTYLMSSPDVGSYSLLSPKYFGETLEHFGGEVVGEATWHLGVGDFSPQITEIAAIDPAPDSIFFAGPVPDNAQFVRQLRGAGVDIPVYGTDGFDDPDLVEVGGDAANGVTFSAIGVPTPGTTLGDWLDDCKANGYDVRNTFAAAAGDAVNIVKAAVESAQSTVPADITAAIKELSGVPGITTPSITYAGQSLNIPERSLAIIRVEDGVPTQLAELTPSFIPNPD
jgi:branched-chain amino acid transport system substrate-binding protein